MLAAMSSNRDRVYAVTGAASGIGRATVERLIDEGASVVAVDLSAEALAWTGPVEGIEAVVGDVTTEETNKAMVDAARARFGALHGVFLNAGIPGFGLVDRAPLEMFDRVMEVNVRAVVLGIRASLGALREVDGGAIVVTGSTSGLAADPGGWSYNASKAGGHQPGQGHRPRRGPRGHPRQRRLPGAHQDRHDRRHAGAPRQRGDHALTGADGPLGRGVGVGGRGGLPAVARCVVHHRGGAAGRRWRHRQHGPVPDLRRAHAAPRADGAD